MSPLVLINDPVIAYLKALTRREDQVALSADRDFLGSLDWTDAQLSVYSERVAGIESRLQKFQERAP